MWKFPSNITRVQKRTFELFFCIVVFIGFGFVIHAPSVAVSMPSGRHQVPRIGWRRIFGQNTTRSLVFSSRAIGRRSRVAALGGVVDAVSGRASLVSMVTGRARTTLHH